MAQQGSPLLDQYNQDGIVTPALQRVIDRVKLKLPQFQGLQPPATPATAPRLLTPPGTSVPSITRSATPAAAAPVPTVTAPVTPAPMITDPDAGKHLAERDRLIRTGSGISQVHNPIARGLLRAADIAGSAFFPNITAQIPGTELHHRGLVQRSEGVVDKDVARAKENAGTANLEAETQKNLLGHIPTNELELWAQQNPGKSVEDFLKLKRENAPERNETPFDLWRKQNPDAPAEQWLKTEEGAKYHAPNEYEDFKTGYLKTNPQAAPDEIVSKFTAAKQPAQRTPQNEYEDFKAGYLQKNPNADAFEVTREYAKAHQSPERPPQQFMFEPDGQGGYKSVLVNQPGQHISAGAVTPNQAGSQNVPTTQMRNVAAQAQLVHEQTPYMLSEIDRLKNKLGPVSGRWNEVMQGKLGMEDPDMAGIRADLLMYSSAVALMHARGRLPENLREEFDRNINNPGQDFKNLKSVITKIDNWTVKNPGVKDSGGAQGGQIPTVTTQAEYDKLPKGAEYMEGGKKYRKP